jgi:hypothetical protein
VSSNGDWRVTLSYQARLDLFTFPWSPDVERGGVLTGRWERPNVRPVDTGRDVFIRRVFVADANCDSDSVEICTDRVGHLETIMVNSRPGSRGGRWGKDDAGTVLGDIHSHPGFTVDGDRARQLSGTDVSRAAALALAPGGRPWLSAIATATERWEGGYPAEDWDDPQLDFFLVFPDERIVKPRVSWQTETEWDCEEGQRQLLAASGAD